jgi:hypothetical protein
MQTIEILVERYPEVADYFYSLPNMKGTDTKMMDTTMKKVKPNEELSGLTLLK